MKSFWLACRAATAVSAITATSPPPSDIEAALVHLRFDGGEAREPERGEVDPVDAGLVVLCHVAAAADLEHEGVDAAAAEQPVGAGAAGEDVGAAVAAQRVVAEAAEQEAVAAPAGEIVVAHQAVILVVAPAADEDGGARMTLPGEGGLALPACTTDI